MNMYNTDIIFSNYYNLESVHFEFNITTNSFSKKRSLSHELVTRRLKTMVTNSTIVTNSQTPRVSKTSDPRQNKYFFFLNTFNRLPSFTIDSNSIKKSRIYEISWSI